MQSVVPRADQRAASALRKRNLRWYGPKAGTTLRILNGPKTMRVIACGSFCVILSLLNGCGTPGEPGDIATRSASGPGPLSSEPATDAERSAAGEFATTDSGLKYRILREGTGAKPTAADTVTVHYRGWLDDLTEFDSSYTRGQPATFPLSGVVAGWTEGLQLVGEGGEIELEIPSELGYGSSGAGGTIPPNATLHFSVELLSIQ